jgi:hypothetical protein
MYTHGILPDEVQFQAQARLSGLSAQQMADQIVLLFHPAHDSFGEFEEYPMTVTKGLALMEELDRQAKVEIAELQKGKN